MSSRCASVNSCGALSTILVCVLGLAAFTSNVAAQTGAATLTGFVLTGRADLGNVLPGSGATIVATNMATGVAYTGLTTSVGVYTITGLPVGTYAVAVTLPGFKTPHISVSVSASQTARLDFQLEPGLVEVTIDVHATGLLLQTEDPVVVTRLDVRQVEELPSMARNPGVATLFAPGAVSPHSSSFTTLKNTFDGRPYVNGQREQSNAYMVDGVDINDAVDNFVAYQPSPDALEQISIATSNYSPELGNVAGAVVNLVLKSGTDAFKGSAFYSWRDNALAATPWETNRLGGRKSEFTRTLLGGTMGGPIVGHKVFFFGDYQGGRQTVPTPVAFATVAPDSWRAGDLSSLLASNLVVRDPLTRQPFPNNQIPVQRIGAFARALFADASLYPRPNVARTLPDFRSNYQGRSRSSEETNQFDAKIDWAGSPSDKLSLRYSFQNDHARSEQTVMPLVFGTASTNPYRGVAAQWNRVASGASRMNDVLLGYNDNAFDNESLDLLGLGSLNAGLGIAGSQPVPGLSEVQLGNGITTIGSRALNSQTRNRMLQLGERLTWLSGRQTWKLGGEWQYYRMRRYYSGNNGVLGKFGYDGSFTGVAFGDFLLDLVTSKGRGSLAEPWTQLQHRVALYAADDFKVRDELTLNLGVRWAYSSPLVERDDRQANFDLTNARELFAGRDGNSRPLYSPYYHGWEPRLGVAYRPRDRWVLRGAYGVTQSMEGTGANLRLPLNPPFFFESEVRYDATSGPGAISSGFDGLLALDQASGQVRAWDPDLRPQFIQQWNAFWESQLGGRSSLAVGYVGSRSTHLVTPVDGNQPLPGEGDPRTWAPLQVRRPLYAFNPLLTSVSTTASRGRARYDGLQTMFHEWLGDLTVSANYTFSRAMTNNVGYYGSTGVAAPSEYPMNSSDIELDYGPAFFDATHVVSALATYELPFGRARAYGSSWNRLVDGAIGGWSVTSALTAHSGFPITVIDGSSPSLQGSRGSERPNRIASGTVDNPTLARWIDRAAFVSAPRGQFGNSGVGILRAPGYRNLDLSLSKRVPLPGHSSLVVRGEAYNVLNIPSFGPPVADIQSQNFGAIFSTVNTPRIIQLVAKYYF